MKLRLLLLAFCMVTGLKGMEEVDVPKKADSLLDALKIGGGLVVYRSNDPISAPEAKRTIGNLRNNDGSKNAIDFIVTDELMYEAEGGKSWVSNSLAINSVVNYQFYGTRFSRGMVLCRIASHDTKPEKQLIQEINDLLTNWPVVVHINNDKMNAGLKKYFSEKKATILGEEPKSNYLRTFFMMSGIALAIIFYIRFVVPKK
jgi:hypothetical protein